MFEKRRGLAPIFGLALVVALAGSALAASAAQASPAWHIFGKTLAERGESQAEVSVEGGTVSFEPAQWGWKVTCDRNEGWGYVSGEDKGTTHLWLDDCVVFEGEGPCKVAPIEMDLDLGLVAGGETGVIETLIPHEESSVPFAKLEFSGEDCYLGDEQGGIDLYYAGGSIGGEVSQDGPYLALAASPEFTITAKVGGEDFTVTLDGSLAQWEASGQTLEAW